MTEPGAGHLEQMLRDMGVDPHPQPNQSAPQTTSWPAYEQVPEASADELAQSHQQHPGRKPGKNNTQPLPAMQRPFSIREQGNHGGYNGQRSHDKALPPELSDIWGNRNGPSWDDADETQLERPKGRVGRIVHGARKAIQKARGNFQEGFSQAWEDAGEEAHGARQWLQRVREQNQVDARALQGSAWDTYDEAGQREVLSRGSQDYGSNRNDSAFAYEAPSDLDAWHQGSSYGYGSDGPENWDARPSDWIPAHDGSENWDDLRDPHSPRDPSSQTSPLGQPAIAQRESRPPHAEAPDTHVLQLHTLVEDMIHGDTQTEDFTDHVQAVYKPFSLVGENLGAVNKLREYLGLDRLDQVPQYEGGVEEIFARTVAEKVLKKQRPTEEHATAVYPAEWDTYTDAILKALGISVATQSISSRQPPDSSWLRDVGPKQLAQQQNQTDVTAYREGVANLLASAGVPDDDGGPDGRKPNRSEQDTQNPEPIVPYEEVAERLSDKYDLLDEKSIRNIFDSTQTIWNHLASNNDDDTAVKLTRSAVIDYLALNGVTREVYRADYYGILSDIIDGFEDEDGHVYGILDFYNSLYEGTVRFTAQEAFIRMALVLADYSKPIIRVRAT